MDAANTKTNFKRVWMITGAARGIGARIAEAALARGEAVVATSRDADSVRKRFPESDALLALPLDVTDEAQAAAAVQAALARFGRIDVLVNNAGYGLLGAVEEAGADEVKKQFDTNVFGLLHVTRAVLPVLRAQGSGHVINISSIGGYASHPGWGVYCATKFAVEGLTEALAAELAPLGIRATVVEPGFFRTDFLNADSVVSTGKRIEQYAASVGVMRTLMADANHKQPGDPAKLSQAILKLADDGNPPLRLALGSDTVTAIRKKNQFVEAELQAWMPVSVSTNHDDVAA